MPEGRTDGAVLTPEDTANKNTDWNPANNEASRSQGVFDKQVNNFYRTTDATQPNRLRKAESKKTFMQTVRNLTAGVLALIHPVSTAAPIGGPAAADAASKSIQAVGATFERAGDALYIPNAEQRLAAELLQKPDSPKTTYRVANLQEIIEAHGLAIRTQPGIPFKGDPPNVQSRIQPGELISNAVNITGGNTKFGPDKGAWVAFQDDKGHVLFANRDYLEEVKPK